MTTKQIIIELIKGTAEDINFYFDEDIPMENNKHHVNWKLNRLIKEIEQLPD
jgi:hypothetical protein